MNKPFPRKQHASPKKPDRASIISQKAYGENQQKALHKENQQARQT